MNSATQTAAQRTRHRVRLLVRVAISVALVGYLALTTELGATWAALERLGPGVIAASLGLTTVGWTLMAVRWWVLLRGAGYGVPAWRAWVITQSSQFYGFFSPGQVGSEISRWLKLYGDARARPFEVAATLLFDRLMGLAVLTVLGGVALLVDPVLGGSAGAAVVAVVLLAGGAGFVALAGIGVKRVWPFGWLVKTPAFESAPPWVAQVWAAVNLYAGAWASLAWAATISVGFHAVNVLFNWLIAMELGVPVTLAEMTTVYAAVSVLVMIPVSIAGIGVREVSFTQVLGLLGYQSAAVVAIPVVVFGVTLVAAVVLGGGVELLDIALSRRRGQDSGTHEDTAD